MADASNEFEFEFEFEFDNTDPLADFSGVARLFPLPNVVLFPGGLLPLHIFEPRYRQMVADAVGSDRLITMVLLKPGFDADYEGAPAIHTVGCIGSIVEHQTLADGRSNLVLQGLARVRIDSEPTTDRMYRSACVTLLEDEYPAAGASSLCKQMGVVMDSMRAFLRLMGRSEKDCATPWQDAADAGRLCDTAAHCLGLDVAVKQSLLDELRVARRLDTLMAWMQALLKALERKVGPDAQPPDFSAN
jgi:Lon protease-like protein